MWCDGDILQSVNERLHDWMVIAHTDQSRVPDSSLGQESIGAKNQFRDEIQAAMHMTVWISRAKITNKRRDYSLMTNSGVPARHTLGFEPSFYMFML